MSRDTDMTPTKDALEREIEETRDSLVDTIDAIVERVDPHEVASRNAEQAKRTIKRTAETAQERAQETWHEAEHFVQDDPDRARNLAIAAGAVLVLLWMWRRRRSDAEG